MYPQLPAPFTFGGDGRRSGLIRKRKCGVPKKGAARPLTKALIYHDSWAADWAFLNQMISERRCSPKMHKALHKDESLDFSLFSVF
jgi:hypothetical protein